MTNYTFADWLNDAIKDAEDLLAERKATSPNQITVMLAQARVDILLEVEDEFTHLP